MTANPISAMTVLVVLVRQSQLAWPLPLTIVLWIACVLALAVAFRTEKKR